MNLKNNNGIQSIHKIFHQKEEIIHLALLLIDF